MFALNFFTLSQLPKTITSFRISSILPIQFRNKSSTTKSTRKSTRIEKINSNLFNSKSIGGLLKFIDKYNFKENEKRFSTDCEKENAESTTGRFKYSKEIEEAINNQITSEFSAAFSYLSVACYFGRTNVGLLGTQQFYRRMYSEEIEHALALIKYQELRGGHVELKEVNIGSCESCTIQKSLEIALRMEKGVCDQLFQILKLAQKQNDIRTEDFISTDFIQEQLQSLRNIGNLLTNATRMAESGLSQYMLDKEISTQSGHRTIQAGKPDVNKTPTF
ncbi:ferritin [Holotrichia oblita]|uniref:Ferritin n=2 Tax=Holotrichia oblita TaxID=644536 RepID=A0ACB9T6Y5_HOLOL|nr:ferritin [Holotrichia oblita]KAI4462590.1 ferritin [Holotrichia oblita]